MLTTLTAIVTAVLTAPITLVAAPAIVALTGTVAYINRH